MHGMQETWVSPLGWEDALPCPMGGGHGNPLKLTQMLGKIEGRRRRG